MLSSHDQLTQQCNPYLPLSAKQRRGIAASVAWSVLHLSGSPWLGDHWDENQMSISLENGSNGREVPSQHPCASCIFSTPATPEERPTNDLKDLIPNRTVFALGILLIELCINKSFAEIRQVSGNATSTLQFGDYRAALNTLDEVRCQAGDLYGNAAERCLKFVFEGRDQYKNFDFVQFRQQFYDTVVAPVQATYLLMPGSQIHIAN
jgi:hypothetical protein